jgi:hypothetical protein
MRNRSRRSERGDVSLEPVLLVLGMALAFTIVTVVVIGIVQHPRLVTLAYLAGGLVLVGVAAVGWDRVERRRAARPVAPFQWVPPLRHEPMTVELASGAHLLFDGVELATDPSVPGDDVDATLEVWRLGRPEGLPPVLAQAARARWASLELGLTGKALDRWLRGIDSVQRDLENPQGMSADEVLLGFAFTPAARQAAWWTCLDQAPTPEAMGELLEAGVRSGDEGACWRWALGRRPLPSEIRELLAAGWRDGYEADDWARAFGRLPDRSECEPLLAAGIEGWQAAQWAKATAVPRNLDTIQELQRAGVLRSPDALWWSEVVGTPLSVSRLRPWQEAGVESSTDAMAWGWALGDAVSPEAIRRLRDTGVRDGADASCWRKALGEVPTPDRVGEMIARGIRTGKQAERRLARESAGRR